MDLALGFQSALHFFISGGLVMYPLLILSIITVAIFIERYMYFKNNTIKNNKIEELSAAISSGDLSLAKEICNEKSTIITRTIKNGLEYSDCATALKNSVTEQMTTEAKGMKCHLDFLSAIVTIAPLLGLLGTVSGMISTFSILDSGMGASAISGGVGEALIATASGLCVAIIAFIFYTYFAHKVTRTIDTTEELCNKLMDTKRKMWRANNV